MILILFAITILVTIFYFLLKPNDYWAKKNIQTGKVIPVFGDSFLVIMGKESNSEMISRLYNKFDNVRYIGTYMYQTPVLVVKSPQLIKQICVKDFDHFLDHEDFLPADVDILWSRSILGMRGEAWKSMRTTLSPAFTSSKMKAMFILMCQNAESFTQYFLNREEDIAESEFKDAFTRYANDVIATTVFGLKIDSLNNRENAFYMMGRSASDFTTFSKKFGMFVGQICPSIANFFQVSFFGHDVKNFFINLVKDTIKVREEQNIKQPDLLGILLEARKCQNAETTLQEEIEESSSGAKECLSTRKINLTDIDLAAQMFIFFFGGFDTVSKALCFMAYELAVNPDIQKKLIEEIDKNRPQKGLPSYETIMQMTYMEMVVSETMRKWPPGLETDRIVTKPYTIEPESPNEKPLYLEPNLKIIVPILGLHHDAQYFPNPEKFDPERFSPENRDAIVPYSYIPFGVGPRNCIAYRFALMEIKTLFFYLLSSFEIVPIKETQIPLKISRKSLDVDSENGFPLGLKRRGHISKETSSQNHFS